MIRLFAVSEQTEARSDRASVVRGVTRAGPYSSPLGSTIPTGITWAILPAHQAT